MARPSATPPATGARLGVQASFDELGVPLADLTFVVVDLETTGGSPADCAVTEIGAVKVRAGEVLGELHSLVDPGQPIPPFIAVLTGITDRMVAGSPTMAEILPTFLEFARGAVLVAHNAPFDLGFLKAAAARHEMHWPRFDVVDTARLARRTLLRDEAPDCTLATLARLFRATTTPTHRALDDARATVDVLHGLFERVGCSGVTTWDELLTFSTRVPAQRRRKRHLADAVPRGPGVYLFRDGRQRVLYVGKSTDMRPRVRQYFTSSEQRRRMTEMVACAEEVVAIPCPTLIEAEVRELRLIADHKPPYNRRSKFPEKSRFVTLTDEPFPRLSTVRTVRKDGPVLGPIGSAKAAELATAALHEAFGLRQCTARLSPRRPTSACILAEIGRCGAPCTGAQSVADYSASVASASAAIDHDPAPLVEALVARIRPLAEQGRYETAAAHRDRLLAFLRTAARTQRLSAFTRCPLLVAACRTDGAGWQVVVVRYGRMCASGVAPAGADPWPVVHGLVEAAESPRAEHGPVPAASADESECLLRWFDASPVRLVVVEGTWCSPANGAQASLHRLDAAVSSGLFSSDTKQ